MHMLHKQRCFSSNKRNFLSIKIVSMWNSLPADTTDFSRLDKINNSVSNMFLLKFCQVNFEWISPCDTDTYIVCFYVITCIIALFYDFMIAIFETVLLQHVRGPLLPNKCMYVCKSRGDNVGRDQQSALGAKWGKGLERVWLGARVFLPILDDFSGTFDKCGHNTWISVPSKGIGRNFRKISL